MDGAERNPVAWRMRLPVGSGRHRLTNSHRLMTVRCPLLSPLQYYLRAFVVSFDGACRYPLAIPPSSYRRPRRSYRPALKDTVHIIHAHVYVCKDGHILLACPAHARHLKIHPFAQLMSSGNDAPGHKERNKGKVRTPHVGLHAG